MTFYAFFFKYYFKTLTIESKNISSECTGKGPFNGLFWGFPSMYVRCFVSLFNQSVCFVVKYILSIELCTILFQITQLHYLNVILMFTDQQYYDYQLQKFIQNKQISAQITVFNLCLIFFMCDHTQLFRNNFWTIKIQRKCLQPFKSTSNSWEFCLLTIQNLYLYNMPNKCTIHCFKSCPKCSHTLPLWSQSFRSNIWTIKEG